MKEGKQESGKNKGNHSISPCWGKRILLSVFPCLSATHEQGKKGNQAIAKKCVPYELVANVFLHVETHR